MKITERVREIVELNLTNHYIPLAVLNGSPKIYPEYYGRFSDENVLVFPATGATGIGRDLAEAERAQAMVADRAGGFEAYLLEGSARYVSGDEDYDLISMMQNESPGFPIHGAVVFKINNVRLMPPP
ncbi:MAG: hypothetical protein WCT06_02010 [Armatimonadota bacterium]|jgi:hypothetical protein|nr:hypothetical protein [Armatimonadota bacterium]